MLDVVIGLVFVFLLYSLLATTIMELLAGWLSLRGKNLEKALRNMLASAGDKRRKVQFFEHFKSNSIYEQLKGKAVGKKSPPSCLSSEKFRLILTQVIDDQVEGESFRHKVELLPEGNMKNSLLQLLDDAGQNFGRFQGKVELWYDDVMDRASGWYKRSTQAWLLFLGLGIAVVFNVDTLSIYRRLAQDPELQKQVVEMAQAFVQANEQAASAQIYSPETQEKISTLVNQNIEALESPLGIGWDEINVPGMDPVDWAYKAFGWLITALAISLGAPFWFDLLRKLVNVRSSGQTPNTAPVVTVNTGGASTSSSVPSSDQIVG